MKQVQMTTIGMLLVLCACVFTQAQQTVATSANAVVPPLVKFGGTLTDVNDKPLSGVVGVTFALYKDQQGGAPLWLETQNVTADNSGHYSIMLGSTSSAGLPTDLFASGEARWLGIQPQGQAEQPRVLLLSVPYALKAGDAQTLGGLPASAFALAGPPNSGATSVSSQSAAAAVSASVSPATTSDVTTSGGTDNAVAMFTTPTNVQNSLLTQTGTSTINVGGKLNLPATGTATATAGKNSQSQTFVASAFNSTTSTAVPQTFQWRAEPAGNDTASPSGTLNLLFGPGATPPTETKLSIASNGQITFASGQAFPGAGTIIGVTAGTDLTGGGTSGNVTLNLNTSATDARYAQLNALNTFTQQQNINAKEIISASSNFEVLDVKQSGGTGDGIHGNTSSSTGYGVEGTSPNVGVFGNGTGSKSIGVDGHGASIGVKGVATASTGLAGLFQGNVRTEGNLSVIGTVHSGNAWGVAAASNITNASTNDCTTPPSVPNPNCLTPNMSVTVTTTGGPVLIMANIGGVIFNDNSSGASCTTANFLLVMDSEFIASKTYADENVQSVVTDATFMSVQTPAAGIHTFQVQEWDNAQFCGSGDYSPTQVSSGGENVGVSASSTRTLFVREL
jgi:hypothetical protein